MQPKFSQNALLDQNRVTIELKYIRYGSKMDQNKVKSDLKYIRKLFILAGDRIIEVNWVNISQENHKQVVQRIKAVSNETRLLVVDKEADEFYKKSGILITHSMENVLNLTSIIDDQEQENNPKVFQVNEEQEKQSNSSVEKVKNKKNNAILQKILRKFFVKLSDY